MAKKLDNETADSATNGGSHGAESGVLGAPSSNTAPYNCIWTDGLAPDIAETIEQALDLLR